MKILITILAVVTLSTAAFADSFPPSSPLWNPLLLDITDPANALLANYGDTPIVFDGYSITSISGSLDPDAWTGLAWALNFSNHFDVDIYNSVEETFGSGHYVSSFISLQANSSVLTELASELENPAYAVLQPGAVWNLGAIAPNSNLADLGFTYIDSITYPSWGQIDVAIIPEPATLSLLAVGAAVVGRRKR